MSYSRDDHYYRPRPILPDRSRPNVRALINKYRSRYDRPDYNRPRYSRPDYDRPQRSWCQQVFSFIRSNPQLMQALRQRPDILQMIRSRCGGANVSAAPVYPRYPYYRPPYRRPPYYRPPYQHPMPPYPYPRQPPRSGCGYGKRFDRCLCRCVPKDAITPQCIRDCTSGGGGSSNSY